MLGFDTTHQMPPEGPQAADPCQSTSNPAATPQQAPTEGTRAILPLVMEDYAARARYGMRTYGRPLEAFNNRDSFMDAYQEALDLPVFLRQFKYELDEVLDQVERALVYVIDHLAFDSVYSSQRRELDLALTTLVTWRANGLSFKGNIGGIGDDDAT